MEEDERANDPLWSLERAAEHLGCSVPQLRRFYKKQDLEVTSLGPKLIRVRKSQVESLIQAHTGPWKQIRK